MNKYTENWMFRGALLAAIAALTGCPAATPDANTTPEASAATATETPAEAPAVAAPTGGAPVTTQIMTHPSQGEKRVVDGAQATLLATQAGAMLNLQTKGLTPGHVYTLWVIVINKPEACATSPCTGKDFLKNTEAVNADIVYGDGVVAGADGSISMTSWIPTGAWNGSWYGNGFNNAFGAEIQATINDHGPIIAGQEHAMLTSYRAQCTDESLPPPFPDAARADGAPGPNKCALTQFLIFQQK